MTAPIPAPPARVVEVKTGKLAPGITPVVREIDSLRAEVDRLNEALLDAREDRNLFADRADLAARELARLQERQVRVDEQASRIQALETALAAAVSERDTARAGMAGRGQK